MCPNDSLSFYIVGADSDTTLNLYFSNDIDSTIPSAITTVKGINPDTTFFNWAPTINDIGLHHFSIIAQNNACLVF